MIRRCVALPVGLLVSALVLAACGGTENTGSRSKPPADPNAPITGPPGGGDTGDGLGAGNPQIVTPRQGLANIHPIDWDQADVSDDDRKVRVQFYDGIEECYGLADLKVEYRKDSIVVSLFGGTVPNAGVCIEIAVLKGVIVELTEAVGGRQIIDGAPQ